MCVGVAETSYDVAMSQELIDVVNALPGWVREMGLTIVSASVDEVVGEMVIAEKHHQGYGIVHGGVHCGIVETLASVGAALVALPRGQRVVGLENSTSFIRATRSGTLRGTARPLTRGRTTQLWEAAIHDGDGALVAQGRVRLLCLDGKRELG